ncbi:MBL fold metallo-hydrolase [Labedaea rhizosphaerae]|uniref:Glyoxylase-like metal-dependent hydrolase (Beta-lactamase superfamily II) n=1 Tax=Labedaea rhizosphaerae TaxID=598644 RepID=A0A4R6S957_LABRH|nr:MBL fold metallo-hydrolase [Labedaea rhizosphaerae]TDP96400.1 glyoxylase-like metal-dependent hydrolase (beta-lactamase superfamily II) [Labedaea rhizosphaerae]
MTWIELAEGVLARRYAELDQTLGIVIGSRRCLVIDTGTDEVHGAEHAAAIRELTPLPWTVVITHGHWDHHYGTRAFMAFQPCPVLAHPLCAKAMASTAERDEWAARYRAEGRTALADRIAAVRIVAPTEVLPDRVELELGDRTVELLHPGRGHTDHDVVVHVPDAGVVFTGDLVEQGAPPSVGPDAHLGEWPSTLDAVLATGAQVFVPGHGNPVDADFVRAQRDELSARARSSGR